MRGAHACHAWALRCQGCSPLRGHSSGAPLRAPTKGPSLVKRANCGPARLGAAAAAGVRLRRDGPPGRWDQQIYYVVVQPRRHYCGPNEHHGRRPEQQPVSRRPLQADACGADAGAAAGAEGSSRWQAARLWWRHSKGACPLLLLLPVCRYGSYHLVRYEGSPAIGYLYGGELPALVG